MAAKSQKIKSSNKADKKAAEKLEISLTKKIKDFVFSLGHDAEEIGEEIKKTSKVLAKRLNRKISKAKHTLDEKVKQVKKSKKSGSKESSDKVEKIVSKAKKDSKKLAKKASSVKTVDVLPAINKGSKKASPATASSAKPVKIKKPQETQAKDQTAENPHPETPEVSKRKAGGAPIPKSHPKPQNTDLPLEAGPRNKYKRG